MTLTKEQIETMPEGYVMDGLIAERIFNLTVKGHYTISDTTAGELNPYSQEIWAAWKVVEKFRAFNIIKSDIYAASAYLLDGNGPRTAFAGTAPLAICRASLLTTL